MAIRLKLDDGFQKMIKDIELSQNQAERVANSCIRQSAQIMQSELKSEMKRSDLDSALADRMPAFQVLSGGGKYKALVGFTETPYNPRNPSDYYKAIFANYGTPNRKKHGKERARGFVQRAKKAARPKIKKQQKVALKKILERLK